MLQGMRTLLSTIAQPLEQASIVKEAKIEL
jgi:hypothetical protein